MKNIHFKPFLPCVGLLLVLFLIKCDKEWDKHYDVDNFNLPDKTLNDLIREKSNLSIFYSLLIKTGYDKILNASQSYTIWAPVNDAFTNFDTTDEDMVRKIVENHIARSRITTSGIENKLVRMLNGKYINFKKEASTYTFGNNKIIESNLPAINGLIHIVEGYTPYLNNIWEYIGATQNLDSLKYYLYSQNKYIFDPENSIEIGIDSTGSVIYDSVLVLTNLVLKKIGSIDNEDSIYTAILPDNTAWIEAYNRIEGFFIFPENAGGNIRKHDLTRYTIVKDMLFHGQITQPLIFDSLVSTTGTIFQNPSYLFDGNSVTLSNGVAYVTNQMPFVDTISWFKKIKVEAENSEGRDFSGCNIYTRTSYGSELNVSEYKYILVDPRSLEATVKFSIPNTLSAKYNIYCVFVPAIIVDPLNLTPTKVKYKLTYIRRSNGSTFVTYFIPQNNITNPTDITKMFVGQFKFDYANVIDEDYDNVAVKLDVINIVTTAEEQAGTFSKTMRIDCVIFEPVSE